MIKEESAHILHLSIQRLGACSIIHCWLMVLPGAGQDWSLLLGSEDFAFLTKSWFVKLKYGVSVSELIPPNGAHT